MSAPRSPLDRITVTDQRCGCCGGVLVKMHPHDEREEAAVLCPACDLRGETTL